MPEMTGPIAGQHEMDSKLNGIKGGIVLYFRAGHFLEATLPQAGIIRGFGTIAGPLEAAPPLPTMAMKGIGAAAQVKLDFQETQRQELQGQPDMSYARVAAISG